MDNLYTYLMIGGVITAPFILLHQYFRIRKRYASQTKTHKIVVLNYFTGTVSIAYALGITALWIYMWFLMVPDTSLGASFAPEAQRLIGIVFFGGVAFLFVAPIVAASLLTLNSTYKHPK